MPSRPFRNLAGLVHDALRSAAEAPVHGTSSAFVERSGRGGIDFAQLQCDRAALGVVGGGPNWSQAIDDPTLSRRVLGLPDE